MLVIPEGSQRFAASPAGTPAGVRWCLRSLTGGVAALNHRLMAANPSGSVPPGMADNSPAIYRWVVGRCHSAESRQGRKTETRIIVPINHSFAPAGAMESCSRLDPSDESLGYFRNVPVGTKARITNARVRGSQSAAGGRPGAAEPFPRLKLPTKRAEPAVVSKDALI